MIAAKTQTESRGFFAALSGQPMAKQAAGPKLRDIEKSAVGDQPWIGASAAVITVVGKPERFAVENADRLPPSFDAERYLYIEAGAMAQNGALMATELQLGSVLVAGFDPDRTAKALRLRAGERPLLHLCLGNRA